MALHTDAVDDSKTGAGSSKTGWRFARRIEGVQPSLSEVYATIPVPAGGSWLRRLIAFSGPGYLVSVTRATTCRSRDDGLETAGRRFGAAQPFARDCHCAPAPSKSTLTKGPDQGLR